MTAVHTQLGFVDLPGMLVSMRNARAAGAASQVVRFGMSEASVLVSSVCLQESAASEMLKHGDMADHVEDSIHRTTVDCTTAQAAISCQQLKGTSTHALQIMITKYADCCSVIPGCLGVQRVPSRRQAA